jgi:hypothetical protein
MDRQQWKTLLWSNYNGGDKSFKTTVAVIKVQPVILLPTAGRRDRRIQHKMQNLKKILYNKQVWNMHD